jgi:hypothetical protein
MWVHESYKQKRSYFQRINKHYKQHSYVQVITRA